MMLLEAHRQKLLACGLRPETWSRAQLHSGRPAEVRDILGYGVQGGGLIIPYDEGYARVRIDNSGPDGQDLRRRGAEVYVLRLPDGPRGNKQGLDDFFVAEGLEAFRKLPMQTVAEADAELPTMLRVSDLADQYLLRLNQPHAASRWAIPSLMRSCVASPRARS